MTEENHTTRHTRFVSDGQTIETYIAEARQPIGATVLMLGAIWSVTPHIRSLCDRLAAAGIHAVAPCLFRGVGIPAHDATPQQLGEVFLAFDDRRCLRDLKVAVNLLDRGHFGLDAGRIVTWGFCLGGRFAHDLAAVTTQIAGVVNFYGRVRFARQPIKPFLPIELAPLIQVPYLGHFADVDGFIPASDVEDLRTVLTAHGTPNALHVYPGTQHAFFDPTHPAGHDPEASTLAWTRSLDFVKTIAAGGKNKEQAR
jgi:carboxymethylenebutenolidase